MLLGFFGAGRKNALVVVVVVAEKQNTRTVPMQKARIRCLEDGVIGQFVFLFSDKRPLEVRLFRPFVLSTAIAFVPFGDAAILFGRWCVRFKMNQNGIREGTVLYCTIID